MKKILALAMVVLMFTLSACGKKEANVPDVAVSDIISKMKDTIGEKLKENIQAEIDKAETDEQKESLKDYLKKVEEGLKEGQVQGLVETDLTNTEDPFASGMGITGENLEEGIFFGSMISVKSDMIIVLKAKDESKVEDLKAELEEVKNGQINTWQQYLPQEYEKVKNGVLKTKGNYLIYIVNENVEELESVVDEMLTAK